MDWNSRRLTAILENALLEDRATRDATSYACIDANQRASANRQRFADRQAAKRQAALAARRARNQRLAFGSIVLVLVIVAVLVVVKVSGGGGSSC